MSDSPVIESTSVRWYDRVALRLSLSIVVIILVTAFTVASLILRDEKNILEAALRVRARQLSEIMVRQVIEPILYEETFNLHTLLQSYLDARDSILVYASIYNEHGELLVSGKNPSLAGEIPALPEPPPQTPIFLQDIKERMAGRPADFVMPITAHKIGVIGYLRLGVSGQSLDNTLHLARRKVWIATATIAILGIFGALWVARTLIRPVLLINRAARQMGEGDLDQDIQMAGVGEIRQLALTFNSMAGRLKRLIDTIKAAQDNLVRTEKLYALGEFSAGLAHEIKNPLTSIKMLMQRASEEEEPLCAEDLEVIIEELDRIDRTVSRFLQGVRPSELTCAATDINRLIMDVIAITRTKIEKSGIRLEAALSPDLPRLQVDSASIKQIFLNGILNALQAMPEGGGLAISTAISGEELHCTLADTGCGITPENLNSIFDPFFTTKEEGTGMGLAVAWNIARQHGGRLDIVSHVDQGTTLTLVLPL
jgi:signal transduction histidine kinase